jgi:hypothetical protein
MPSFISVNKRNYEFKILNRKLKKIFSLKLPENKMKSPTKTNLKNAHRV